MESIVQEHLLADLGPAGIFSSRGHEVQFSVRRSAEHFGQRILRRMRSAGRDGIQHCEHICITKAGHLIPHLQKRIFPVIQCV